MTATLGDFKCYLVGEFVGSGYHARRHEWIVQRVDNESRALDIFEKMHGTAAIVVVLFAIKTV